jgi:uncharacterized protein (TIGR02246 family)
LGEALVDAFNEKDLEAILALFQEDGSYEFPGMPVLIGREKIGKFLRMVFTEALSDMVLTVRALFICDDHGVIEWTNKATTPMGNPYSNQGVFIFSVESGKIQSFREYLDLGPPAQVRKELRMKKERK